MHSATITALFLCPLHSCLALLCMSHHARSRNKQNFTFHSIFYHFNPSLLLLLFVKRLSTPGFLSSLFTAGHAGCRTAGCFLITLMSHTCKDIVSRKRFLFAGDILPRRYCRRGVTGGRKWSWNPAPKATTSPSRS